MAVRVGLVGLGMMGTVHFQAYGEMEGAEVVALCDIDPKRLQKDWSGTLGNLADGQAGGAGFAAATKCEDFRHLLGDPGIDVVDFCVPTHLHAAMAIEALQAGKHVFCEKPMALTSGDALRMAQAAEESGKSLMIGHVLRFWGEYLLMKEMIDTGRFGRLRSGRFWRSGGVPGWGGKSWFTDAALSGGAALDLHIHDTDTVHWLFGVPAKVTSCGSVLPDGGVDYLWTRFHYDGEAAIVSDGGWVAGKYPFTMGATLIFEQAAVDYHSGRSPTLTVYPAEAEPHSPDLPPANAHAEELKYFVGSVAAGTPPQRVTPAEAARSVAIVEAEIRSVKTGQTVAIPVDGASSGRAAGQS